MLHRVEAECKVHLDRIKADDIMSRLLEDPEIRLLIVRKIRDLKT